jgi:hypothetical protein
MVIHNNLILLFSKFSTYRVIQAWREVAAQCWQADTSARPAIRHPVRLLFYIQIWTQNAIANWICMCTKKCFGLGLTSQISWSECWHMGSRLLRIVPSNKVGSWGTMLNFERKSRRPSVLMSTSSMVMLPEEASTSRNKASTRLDFPVHFETQLQLNTNTFSLSSNCDHSAIKALPLPVLPTTPTFVPPFIVAVTPFNTSGMLGRYLNCTNHLK